MRSMFNTMVGSLLLAIMLQACAGVAPGTTQPSQAYTEADEVVARATIVDLAKASAVIAIGRVGGETGTRNMARDPRDASKEDVFYVVLGRDYTLNVERVLKGEAPATITLTIAAAHGDKKAGAVPDRDFVPPTPGQRYLLFLNPQIDGTNGFVPAPEPFRFRLDSLAAPESRWAGALSAFPARPVQQLINEVEAASRP